MPSLGVGGERNRDSVFYSKIGIIYETQSMTLDFYLKYFKILKHVTSALQ